MVRKTCAAVLREQGFHQPAEISVLLVDNEQIRNLNRQYRQMDRDTDVLSFPLCERGVYEVDLSSGLVLLGDIVISVEKAAAQAEMFGHSVQREISYLTCHSMLHLLGYDHVHTHEEKSVMREHEEAIMTALGLSL